MTMTFNDAHFDAFMTFIFDAPPIGHPGPSVAAADLSRPNVLPEVTLEGAVWSITGVTPSGWFALAGRGWCRFTGGADALSAIADACRPLQHLLVSDYHAFRTALSRNVAQADKTRIGDLPVITLEDGQRAVRLADIVLPEVRIGIEDELGRLGPDQRITPEGKQQPSLPPGLIDADLWWRFCRNWKGDAC